MEQNLKLGSLFDGSGGFPLGGMLAGITPVWASEIEPFPIRVTSKRLPQIQHLGDISAINGADIEPVDIITFGSPCQDMSIAGRRTGLDGARSGLFHEAIRVIKEMRCATGGKYPRYIVWENVPGAFSSNNGADFRAVIEEICKVKDNSVSIPQPDKWNYAGEVLGEDFSLAWRVLDAQYWGVPQRRRRIYLVADFTGRSAGKVLFESEGLSGYSATGFHSWQRAARGIENGSGTAECICLNDQGGNRMDVTNEVTCTLRAEAHHPPCVLESAGFCAEHSAKSRNIGYEEEKSPTLRAGVVPATVYENHGQDTRFNEIKDDVAPTVLSTYGTGGNNQPLVVSLPQAYGVCSKDSNAMKSNNPDSGFYKADTSRTLDGNGGNPTCNQGGIAVVAVQGSMIGRADENGPKGCGYDEDVSFTLNTADRHAVAYGIDRSAFNQGQNALYNITIDAERQPTMVAKGPGAVAQPASFYPQMKAESQSYREGVSNTLVNGTNPGFQNGVVVPTYAMTTGDFMQCNEEIAPTLTARDYKDPPVALRCDASVRRFWGNCADIVSAPTVNDTDEIRYIVRRLTPTECARLQGFPDWWCKNLGTENPTDEEIQFWENVFETHRKVMGTATKPKTRKQILKWLSAPYSDSAEYKMWGNGVSLNVVYYVMCGIVWAEKQ